MLLAKHLPRNNVRVVLHRRDQHLVAGGDVGIAVRLGNEVDGFGRSADEDDLVDVLRAQELLNLAASALVRVCGPLGEVVHPAVNVPVVLQQETRHRIDHRLWLLTCRSTVEVDQRLATDGLLEDRESLTNTLDVEASHACPIGSFVSWPCGCCRVRSCRGHAAATHPSRDPTSFWTCARNDSRWRSPTISLANA